MGKGKGGNDGDNYQQTKAGIIGMLFFGTFGVAFALLLDSNVLWGTIALASIICLSLILSDDDT